MASGVEVAPIDVYRLGFGYYVLDGHHRLAAALRSSRLRSTPTSRVRPRRR